MSSDQQKKADFLRTEKYHHPLVDARLESAYQENLKKKTAANPIRLIKDKITPSGLHILEFEQEGKEPEWEDVQKQFSDLLEKYFGPDAEPKYWKYTMEEKRVGRLYLTCKDREFPPEPPKKEEPKREPFWWEK